MYLAQLSAAPFVPLAVMTLLLLLIFTQQGKN
jgi:hypothetical protein